MILPRQASSVANASRRRSRGSALLELLLLLLILVLAGWLVFAVVGRIQQRQRCHRLVADLRGFATAFQRHAQQHRGALPPGTGDAAVPPGMEELLKDTNWTKGPPVGGDYGWRTPTPPASAGGGGPPAVRRGAIVLTAFAPRLPLELSRRDLLAIDAELDDGNLATGRFRTGFNGWPMYLVGEIR